MSQPVVAAEAVELKLVEVLVLVAVEVKRVPMDTTELRVGLPVISLEWLVRTGPHHPAIGRPVGVAEVDIRGETTVNRQLLTLSVVQVAEVDLVTATLLSLTGVGRRPVIAATHYEEVLVMEVLLLRLGRMA